MNRRKIRAALLRLALTAAAAAILTPPLHAEAPRKRVAVVLSGGGAKGIAHIGALKVIERAGIPVDIITGTSMGSLIGGLYAVGWNAQQLDSIVSCADWPLILSDKEEYHAQNLSERERSTTFFFSKTLSLTDTASRKKLPLSSADAGGVISGRNLMRLFRRLTSPYTDSISFATLPTPFACVATDIVTNTECDLTSGVLADAMRSSMSIPGVFAPVRKGDMMLVDGGLRNNYPADLARSLGADVIIGVTVQGRPKTADDLKSGADVLSQIVDVNCKNKYDANLSITDLAIRVDTKGYGSGSFNAAAVDTLMLRGEREAMKHWDELLRLKASLGLAESYRPERPPVSPLAMRPEQPAEAAADTSRLPKISTLSLGVGGRFDSEELAALLVSATLRQRSTPLKFTATARLGRRIGAGVAASLQQKGEDRLTLGYDFRHNDVNVYRRGHRDYNIVYNHHALALTLTSLDVRNFRMSLGARLDSYGYNSVLRRRADADTPSSGNDNLISYCATLDYNSEDVGSFPTRGANFRARYAAHTDNFYRYGSDRPISDLSARWRINLPISRVVTLTPAAYGRMLFGSHVPRILQNVVGGMWFGHYEQQQMPFPATGYVVFAEPCFAAAQLRAQLHITENNYALASIATAARSQKIGDLLSDKLRWGFDVRYFYNTMFGPVGATLGYSSISRRPNFYVNIGFDF